MRAEAGRAHEQAWRERGPRPTRSSRPTPRGASTQAAHDLTTSLDEAALDRLRDAAAELAGAAAAVGRAWTLADREAQNASAVAGRLSQVRRSATELDRRARDEQADADRLATEHAARDAALGATGPSCGTVTATSSPR